MKIEVCYILFLASKFEEAYKNKVTGVIDETEINIISLKDLKINKKASGRYKDLNDLENLP